MFGKKKNEFEITEYNNILLHLSTMRSTSEYEIINNGRETEISYYMFYYSNGERERRLEKSSKCNNDEIISLLNDCGFSKWNGFKGAHPKNVRDGEMFSLKAVVNDGIEISAEGSENFPDNYRKFRNKIQELLLKEDSERE